MNRFPRFYRYLVPMIFLAMGDLLTGSARGSVSLVAVGIATDDYRVVSEDSTTEQGINPPPLTDISTNEPYTLSSSVDSGESMAGYTQAILITDNRWTFETTSQVALAAGDMRAGFVGFEVYLELQVSELTPFTARIDILDASPASEHLLVGDVVLEADGGFNLRGEGVVSGVLEPSDFFLINTYSSLSASGPAEEPVSGRLGYRVTITIPEPASTSFLIGSLACLGLRRRRPSR